MAGLRPIHAAALLGLCPLHDIGVTGVGAVKVPNSLSEDSSQPQGGQSERF